VEKTIMKLQRRRITMPRYFVELSIPDTDKSIGFYSYGDTPESVTPESPFILSEKDIPYDFNVELLTIDETG
jgi:hypothetical protein